MAILINQFSFRDWGTPRPPYIYIFSDRQVIGTLFFFDWTILPFKKYGGPERQEP